MTTRMVIGRAAQRIRRSQSRVSVAGAQTGCLDLDIKAVVSGLFEVDRRESGC